MKIKVLLTSAVTIVLCLCVIAGSTFALFTKDETVTMAITAGALDVDAEVDDASVLINAGANGEFIAVQGNKFENGGKVEIRTLTADGEFNVAVAGMTPGDAFKFDIIAENNSNFAVDFDVNWASVLAASELGANQLDLLRGVVDDPETVEDETVAPALTIDVTDPTSGTTFEPGAVKKFTVTVTFTDNEATNNLFQGGMSKVAFTVIATQHAE